jgi:hypothetical protein
MHVLQSRKEAVMAMHRSVRSITILIALWGSAMAVTPAGGTEKASDALPGGIDSAAVTTGILYDRVVPLSNIDACDGGPDSPTIGLKRWRQIYYEIYRAALDRPAWHEIRNVRDRASQIAAPGAVTIGVMDFRYNRLRPEIFGEGASAVGPGDLLEKRVFAAAALNDHTYRGAGVGFVIDPAFYFTNNPAKPTAFHADFDDGLGFQPIELGRPHWVSYAVPGKKAVRLRADFRDGESLYAGFTFDVRDLDVPSPDDTLFITASIPYLGDYATGEAYIYYGESHTSLMNPVIVIEGFDIDNTMNWEELYESMNQEGMLETMRSMGYDAVVLNFTEAVDYIQRNSFLVVKLIQEVNDLAPPGASLAVIGASMGGLCGRYALAYMEHEGLDHNTRNFISFDAPHKGANIPLGIQYWVEFFSGQSEDAAFLLERLGTPASRQMLVYFYTDPPGATGESDPLFGEFQADLDSIGSYPSGLRKVAVANGSGHMIDQGFAPGDQIILYEYNSFLVDIVGNVWAVSDNAYHIIFDGLIDLIWPLPDDQMVVYVDGTKPYDSAPGGTRASMAQMDSTEAPYGDVVALYDSHCFIPTISALDLDTDDLFYDIAGDPDILAHTPFDTVYYPVENQEHITITAESKNWFLDEIGRGAPSGVPHGDIVAADLRLEPCRPNPFHAAATLRFSVPVSGHTVIEIFDVAGRRVAVLLDETVSQGWGCSDWDGKDDLGRPVASGVYFCVLKTGHASRSQPLVYLR